VECGNGKPGQSKRERAAGESRRNLSWWFIVIMINTDVTGNRADTADAGRRQAHLMGCSDGLLYVVKFQNNPQHRRVLVNELLGTRLGLPTAPVEVVEVSAELIRLTPELCIELPRSRTRIPLANHKSLDDGFGPVFQGFLDLVEELVGHGAVHYTVIVAQRNVAHRTDGNGIVDHHWTLLDGA
jgi:hypothetical protein